MKEIIQLIDQLQVSSSRLGGIRGSFNELADARSALIAKIDNSLLLVSNKDPSCISCKPLK